MLPVQVRVVSSGACTLAHASALLERFLSSDACSDSFASDYVAIVAQALQDSTDYAKHRASSEFPPHGKLLHSHGHKHLLVANTTGLGDVHTDEKQSLSSANAHVATEVGSAEKRHKKKRRHSAVENGLETLPPSGSEMEDSARMHHDRKRRKKEKHERETEDYGPDDQKHRDKKKRKEEQEIAAENAVTPYPAPDKQNLHDRTRRKKEKQGRYVEVMETFHATENRGSPVSLSADGNLDSFEAKKKVEVCDKDASNAGVSIRPLSSKVDGQAGSSKRKRKEDKALFLATPLKVPFLQKNREETASPLGFESLASEEKNKSKKKKRTKEELGELVSG